jgi:outer membrane protein TolC
MKARTNIKLKIKRNGLIIGFLLAFFQFAAEYQIFSQDSLSSYLIIGAKNNPEIKAKYYSYLASLQMVPQVGSLPDPEVTFGYFTKPYVQMMGNQVADIRIMQMFPWFGVRSSARKEAGEMAKARFEEFADARNLLFLNIATQYYQLYQLDKELELAEKNLKFLKTFEQMSLIRFQTGYNKSEGARLQQSSTAASINRDETGDNNSSNTSGMGSQTGSAGQSNMSGNSQGSSMNAMPQSKGLANVLNAQMDILELENQLADLEERKISLQTNFNNYLNQAPKTAIFIPDTLKEIEIIADTIALYDSISRNNPMLKMYMNEQASYQAEIIKTRRMGLPMFGFGLDYMVLTPLSGEPFEGNGVDMKMPMLTLTIPLYRSKYNSMKREAGFKLEEAKEKQKSISNSLNYDLQNVLLDIHNSERRIHQYMEQETLIRESLEVVLSGYKTAGTEFEEVIRMQQKLLQNEFNLTESVVKSRIAYANLDYLLSTKIVTDESQEIINP